MTTTPTVKPDTSVRPSVRPRPSVPVAPDSGAGHVPESQSRTDVSSPTGALAIVALWRRLTLFVAGMAVIVVSLEVGVRLTPSAVPAERSFDRRMPTPYVEFYSEPDFHGGGIDTNSVGFRYAELPRTKPPGEKRVFFLGGSAGFRGATNDQTIAGYMEQMLSSVESESVQRVRVINASGTSFCAAQSLVLLVTRILLYEPDVIVVFHGPESLLYPTVYESRPGYPFNFSVRERVRDKVAGKTDPGNPLTAMLMSLRFMQRFHPNLGRNARQDALAKYNNTIMIDTLDQYDPYIHAVVKDMQAMARVARAHGCRSLLATPPWKAAALLPGSVDRLADQVRAMTLSRDGDGGRFVDTHAMGEELEARRLWRPDGVHWGDEGNKMIAERLVRALDDAGFLQ